MSSKLQGKKKENEKDIAASPPYITYPKRQPWSPKYIHQHILYIHTSPHHSSRHREADVTTTTIMGAAEPVRQDTAITFYNFTFYFWFLNFYLVGVLFELLTVSGFLFFLGGREREWEERGGGEGGGGEWEERRGGRCGQRRSVGCPRKGDRQQ